MSDALSAFYRLPIVLFTPSVSNITVVMGETLNLACNASNFKFRQWLKIGNPVTALANTSDGRVVITPDFQLRIRGVRFDDETSYRCVLRNDLGSMIIYAHVQVVGEKILMIMQFFQMCTSSIIIDRVNKLKFVSIDLNSSSSIPPSP